MPFDFINLLPTSFLNISILLSISYFHTKAGDSRATLQKAELGKVLKFNAAGAAKIKFGGGVGVRWVSRDQFSFLHPLPSMNDTPMQRTVKKARLRRVEVKAIILYTGPCFTLYNAILRGFGTACVVCSLSLPPSLPPSLSLSLSLTHSRSLSLSRSLCLSLSLSLSL